MVSVSRVERSIVTQLMGMVVDGCDGVTYSDTPTGSDGELTFDGLVGMKGICVPGVAVEGEAKNVIGVYSSSERTDLITAVAHAAKTHYKGLEKFNAYFMLCGGERFVDGSMSVFTDIAGDIAIPCIVTDLDTMIEAAGVCGCVIGDGSMTRSLMLSSRPVIYWYGSGFSFVLPRSNRPSMALSQNYMAMGDAGASAIRGDPVQMALQLRVVAATERELRTYTNDEKYWAGIELDPVIRMMKICEGNGMNYHDYKALVSGLGAGIIEADANISIEAVKEQVCQTLTKSVDS